MNDRFFISQFFVNQQNENSSLQSECIRIQKLTFK